MNRSRSYLLVLFLSILAAVLLFVLIGTGIRFARDSARFTNGIRRVDRFLAIEDYDQAERAIRELSEGAHSVRRWRTIASRALILDERAPTDALVDVTARAALQHPDAESLQAIRTLVFLRNDMIPQALDSALRLSSERYDSAVAETAIRAQSEDLETTGTGLAADLLSFSRTPRAETGIALYEAGSGTPFLHTSILLLLERGLFDEAETLLERVAGDPLLLPLAFRVYASRRNLDRALPLVAQLDEQTQTASDVQLLLADIDVLQGDRTSAETRYLRVMASGSNSAERDFARRAFAHLQNSPEYAVDILRGSSTTISVALAADYARARAALGQLSQAHAVLDEAIEQARADRLHDDAARLRILRVVLDQSILPEQRESRVWALMSRYPETGIYGHWLALRAVESGDRRSMQILLNSATDQDAPWIESLVFARYLAGSADDVESLLSGNGQLWYGLFNRGLVLAHRGEFSHATGYIDEALDQAAQRAVSSGIRSAMHVRQAEIFLRANRPRDAEEHVLRARSIDPDNPRARLLERALLSRQG